MPGPRGHFGFWIADFGLGISIRNPKSKIQNRLVAPGPRSLAEANSPQVFNAFAGGNLEIGLTVDFDRGKPVIADLIQHSADGSEVDVAGPKGSAAGKGLPSRPARISSTAYCVTAVGL